jgi:uncharacterized protein (DUF169 family)
MSSIQQDLSVFNKFNFERPPIGVKFLFNKPEGIERLDKNLGFCEMPKEAQLRGTPFYADLENQACEPGTYVLGQDLPPIVKGGYLGAALKAFKEARANRRVYDVMPRLAPGTVNYVAFSPLDKLSFDPDLLIILTDNVSQTEIILRALLYTTGKVLTSKTTIVLGCAWLYAYPYVIGELNYLTGGISYGMKVREAFPEGRQIISIPYDWLETIAKNLQEMPWVPPSFTEDGEEFDNKVFSEMGISA